MISLEPSWFSGWEKSSDSSMISLEPSGFSGWEKSSNSFYD